MDALVIEGVLRLAEKRTPMLAHIEEPVMLADHHLHRRLERLQDLCTLVELRRLAGLSEIAAEENEIRLRVEGVDIVDGLERRADETIIEALHIHVGIGDVGKGEPLPAEALGVRHVDELKALRRDQPLRRRDPR